MKLCSIITLQLDSLHKCKR